MRAIGVSHTACKDEFRRNLRSHSWSVLSFFIMYVELEGINKGHHFQIRVISKLESKFPPDDAFFMAVSKR